MRTMILLGVVAMALTLCGCEPVLSLHPLFDDSEGVFEPGLLGNWIDSDGLKMELRTRMPAAYTLQRPEAGIYTLILVDDKENEHLFYAQLGRLGNALFLDVRPENYDELFQVPAHGFFKVRLEKDALELAFLDDTRVKQMVRENKVKLGHEWILHDDILLTAPTKELQSLVVEYAADTEAFSPVRFHRPVNGQAK